MRVLLTGSSGFTGRYLKNELSRNSYEVCCLNANLLDYASVLKEVSHSKPTAVIHLAAVSHVNCSDVESYYQTNVVGTHNLLKALSESAINLKSVVLASSANVYGNSVGNKGVLTEFDEPSPQNDYAVSKLSMEYMAKLWLEKLPITIVRPFNYTGLGQDERFLIPKIVNHFKYKKPQIKLGNLDVSRDFSDVRDVVSVYRKIIELNLSNHTLNVCSGRAYSMHEVLSVCKELTGHIIDVIVDERLVRENEVKILLGDASHTDELVGKVNRFSLRETLLWMFEN